MSVELEKLHWFTGFDAKKIMEKRGPNRDDIKTVATFHPAPGRAHFNYAQLCSAAPEMLAALEDAADWIDEFFADWETMGSEDDPTDADRELQARIRAAITKARGDNESPQK